MRFKSLFKDKRIHFIGIGGAGMCPMAHMLLDIGRVVSGSDLKLTPAIQQLIKRGALIQHSHDPLYVAQADIVVYSSAITPANPEFSEAKRLGLEILHRSEMLAALMSSYETRIAVSGTHGKTTTTGMIAFIQSQLQKPSSFMVGSLIENLNSSYYFTDSDTFITEADESDGSFLNLDPTLAVITNIEEEHMNYYKTKENLLEHFKKLSENVAKHNGTVVYNYDDQTVKEVISSLPLFPTLSFGCHKDATIYAENIVFSENGTQFTCMINGKSYGDIHLSLYGYHNVYNALAAIAVCTQCGLSFEQIKQQLELFRGTRRRLQYIGAVKGTLIFDDYGHHPTEIKTTLEGLRQSFKSKIYCIFQPHRFSRTKDLLEEFARSFSHADHVILVPIFSAHEKVLPGISSQSIIDAMPDDISNKTEYLTSDEAILESLNKRIKSGDIVVTMGAGNIHTLSQTLLTMSHEN